MPSDRLRVAIDARDVATSSAHSGIGSYTRCLITALSERDDTHVHVIGPPDLDIPRAATRLAIHRRFATGRKAYIEHAARLPIELALRSRADVLHNPSFYPPFGIRRPWVQTLHDVIPLTDRDPDLARLRAWWQHFGRRYRGADAVIAVSAFAAESGIDVLGLDPSRVHVVHHGVSSEFQPAVSAALSDGTEQPYLVVVSEYSERKRFESAFEVIARLADAGYPHRLCVAGRVRAEAQPRFDQLLSEARRADRVEPVGFVDDLPALYRGADVALITSRSEGFGLPALEAMACGTPVVAFANSALTEVVAGGGALVPDGDVDAMTATVRTLLDDRAARAAMVERGLARAATFTWERCAEQTLAVYRTALGR